MIETRHRTTVTDVRSYRGANTDPNHYLVIIGIRARLNKKKFPRNVVPTLKYNIPNLRQSEIKKRNKKIGVEYFAKV